MPSERTEGPLRDILHHIDLAVRFAEGHQTFGPSMLSRAASKLFLRPRAVYPLSQGAPSRDCLETNGRRGNVYRHDYEDIAAQLMWDTVLKALPPLKLVIEGEIERLGM